MLKEHNDKYLEKYWHKLLRKLVLVCLEISIKNNEDKVISFDECARVLLQASMPSVYMKAE
jgi:hypothetical protein